MISTAWTKWHVPWSRDIDQLSCDMIRRAQDPFSKISLMMLRNYLNNVAQEATFHTLASLSLPIFLQKQKNKKKITKMRFRLRYTDWNSGTEESTWKKWIERSNHARSQELRSGALDKFSHRMDNWRPENIEYTHESHKFTVSQHLPSM